MGIVYDMVHWRQGLHGRFAHSNDPTAQFVDLFYRQLEIGYVSVPVGMVGVVWMKSAFPDVQTYEPGVSRNTKPLKLLPSLIAMLLGQSQQRLTVEFGFVPVLYQIMCW